MIKLVCPQCLAKNYTEDLRARHHCSSCLSEFSIEEVAREAGKMNGCNEQREIGAWISNCFD